MVQRAEQEVCDCSRQRVVLGPVAAQEGPHMLEVASPPRAGLVLPLRQTISDAMGLSGSGARNACRRVTPKPPLPHSVELGPNPLTKRLSLTNFPLEVSLPPEPRHAQRLPHAAAAHIRSPARSPARTPRSAADPDGAAGIFKLRGLVVLDVTSIGINHGEEHANALLMLLYRPIRCPARRESVALVGPAQPVVGGAAVFTLADGELFAIDVEGEQHRFGPSRSSGVHSGNGVGIVASTAGALVHDSQYPRVCAAQAAPAPRVDRPAAEECGCTTAPLLFWDDLIVSVEGKSEVIAALHQLVSEWRAGPPDDWENWTVPAYLEAIAAWLEV